MPRDNTPLGENEVLVDYLEELKLSLRELKSFQMSSSTPDMYLGLLGEFAFAKWLSINSVDFNHKTVTEPTELKEDFEVFDPRRTDVSVGIDVKTSGIRTPHAARILSIEQFESIPTHSSILVWTYYSSWRNAVTIDSWSWVHSLREARLKTISAPPDFATSNDPAVDLDFTETKYVYELPSFLMQDIEDLKLRLKGFNGGLICG
jgi:hypothetical protein